MTVANVNVTKVLLKRGNTAQNNNYTGVNGELTIDTQAATLRIHDGTTQGGTVINAAGVAGSYSNTNVAAYLESQSITSANIGGSQTFANANAAVQATAINSLDANIGAFQSYANITLSTIANAASQESAINSINANVGAFQTFANANAVSQITEINSLRANITAANNAITSLTSNAAVQAALLDTLTGNAATQSQVLDTLTSNAATQATTLTTLLSNAVAQQTSLIDLVANAAVQAQFISNTNANTKSYLAAFDGNIIPAANVTYSLGDSTHQWKDLWVSNNTVYINNTPIRVDGDTLLVNNTPIGGGVSGNIVVDTSVVQFVANSSGDGNGYSTVRIIPDTNLEGTDQYLIIDPTAPGHIHIRAGGTQDSSSADLILGGENSHVLITAGSNPPVYIRANSASWMFDTDSSLIMPTGGNLYFDPSATSVIDGITSVILNDPGFIRHSNLTSEIILSENTFRFESNVGTGSSYIEGQQNELFLIGNLTTLIGAGGSTWEFTANGNILLATSGDNPNRGIVYGDGSFQSTAWTGFGNTIAIGYNTGTVSQGGGAVAVGSTAGNVSQGVGAVAVGEAAGRSSQGTEGIAIGKTAGEQSQGAYSIAIGSATAYYQQGLGAVAIGTSAGSLQQGNHAIAIGTGAGSALQGNNSIILNATGSTLDQTTDNTFTVAPIRNATGSDGVLQYNATTKEVSYNSNLTLNVLKIDDGVHEKVQTKSNATGTVTHDCSLGHIFYHTLPSANWTANFTNLNLSSGYATTLTLVIEQGGTGYYPSAVEIEGSAVPLAWQGNTTPTPSSNRIDVVTFSILNDGLYTVLGQLTGF